jgi:4-methoxybenzoate monooxygenase (O-demethylating)
LKYPGLLDLSLRRGFHPATISASAKKWKLGMLSVASPAAGTPISELDILDPAFSIDPHPHVAGLRKLGRVVFLKEAGVWAVSCHADVKAVLEDHETFMSAGGNGIHNDIKEPPRRVSSVLVMADPPLHTRTRGVIQRIMSGPAIRRLRETIFERADALIGPLVEKGTFDAVAEIAEVFPTTVFPEAVGLRLGADGREKMIQYGLITFAFTGPRNEYFDEIMKTAQGVLPWIADQCRRESLSADGFGAQVYAAMDEGKLTAEEAPLVVRAFLAAGLDTTIAGIGRVINCLAKHPDQWRLLADDPELSRPAFEEMMRFDHPSIGVFRTASRDCEFAGVAIPKHEKVVALTGSANRDPAQWSNPDTYDIRRVTVGHLGFGSGIHTCAGMMVVRLEAEAILRALARRVAKLEPAGPPTYRTRAALRRAFASLPIKVTRK